MRNTLLKFALPLVKSHGFTRQALALSVLSLPSSPHQNPLHETAVSALFGEGDDARRTLINAWLDDARRAMTSGSNDNAMGKTRILAEVLDTRLKANEPVLQYLPEAFAVLATPSPSSSLLPPLFFDPRPAISHATSIADEACHIAGDDSVGTAWYARRASLAAVYAAAELHQLTSPKTASQFLDKLLEQLKTLESAVSESQLFGSYVFDSWKGIIKSRGILP